MTAHQSPTPSNRFCIAVSEEFSYRLYLWYPPFKQDELESRWKAIAACGAKGIFKALGGEWIEVFEDSGQDEVKAEQFALFSRLHVNGLYTAHICCDQDSHLVSPDGRVIVHDGFDWESSRGSDNDPDLIAARFTLTGSSNAN